MGFRKIGLRNAHIFHDRVMFIYNISWIILALIVLGIPVGLLLSWKRKVPFIPIIIILNLSIFLITFIPLLWGNQVPYDHVLDDLSIAYRYTSDLSYIPYWHTFLTATFLHGSILHILGNMFFLAIFGMPFEERVGFRKVAIIYLVSGVLANVISGLAAVHFGDTFGMSPAGRAVGASAAIAGIMGAFLVLYPRDEIFMPVGFIFMRAPVFIGVLIFLVIETVLSVSNPEDNVGHLAHVAGLVIGLFIAPTVKRHTTEKDTSGKLDEEALRALAGSDHDLNKVVDTIMEEDVPDVRNAWLENFIERVRCPRCGSTLSKKSLPKYVSCTKCDLKKRIR